MGYAELVGHRVRLVRALTRRDGKVALAGQLATVKYFSSRGLALEVDGGFGMVRGVPIDCIARIGESK